MKTVLRMTPQTQLVLSVSKKLGHSTNHEILIESRKTLPGLSPTTVHRITKRLIANGLLADGPKINGQILVDANTSPHDHFLCNDCDGIKDLTINGSIRDQIKKELGVNNLPSSLTIYGDCQRCLS
jgi:Fur family peroxide stress response transcriptional regulator